MSTAYYEISAPAKLNLFLKILGKRPDGYHDIFTLFQKISLKDRLQMGITPLFHGKSPTIRISAEGWPVPTDHTNLVYKAAQRFMEHSGIYCDIDIKLEKNIPPGSGMGGGSSDAAAMLLAMNSLSNSPLTPSELMIIGKGLGADVPFFLSKYPAAIGQGIGDNLTAIATPKFWFVVIWPGFSISTKWVYDHLMLTNSLIHTNLRDADEIWAFLWQNDLEQAVIPSYAEIDIIKTQLISCGASHAMMTGSGSAVFGVFNTQEEAHKAAEALSIQLKDKIQNFTKNSLVMPITTLDVE